MVNPDNGRGSPWGRKLGWGGVRGAPSRARDSGLRLLSVCTGSGPQEPATGQGAGTIGWSAPLRAPWQPEGAPAVHTTPPPTPAGGGSRRDPARSLRRYLSQCSPSRAALDSHRQGHAQGLQRCSPLAGDTTPFATERRSIRCLHARSPSRDRSGRRCLSAGCRQAPDTRVPACLPACPA
jgi:hypothetical protein